MDADLRAGLLPHLERFPADVAIGKYGDPHVAFVVMVSPDAPPTIAIITAGSSPRDVRVIDAGTQPEEVNAPTDRRWFTFEDMKDAADALSGWLRGWSWVEPDEGETRGAAAYRSMTDAWARRREWAEKEAMADITYQLDHPHVCDLCARRFKTERGMLQHRSFHNPRDTEKPRQSRREYRCDGCKTPFPTAAACSRHEQECWIARASTEAPDE